MANARKVKLRVLYNSRDISSYISPYITSATFVDNAHGKADSLTITVEDRNYLWKGSWKPAKGATLKAWIECKDWYGDGQHMSMYCGSFEIDGLSFSSGGSGDQFTMKAISANVKNSLRKEKTTRAWENSTIRKIAKELAKAADMEVVFETADIVLERIDQVEEGDLGFLQKLAERNGLNLKVAESKLIFFKGAEYDCRPAGMTVTRGDSAIASVRMEDGLTDVYRKCVVTYHDPETKEELEYEFEPDGAPVTGQVLRVNSRVKSLSAAMSLAQNRLRQKNKSQCTGTLSMMGDPRVRGAAVLSLKGYLNFSGNYFVESATHSIDQSGGYSTECQLRKTLSY